MTDEIDSNKQESAETDNSDSVETTLKSNDSGIVVSIEEIHQTHDSESQKSDSINTVNMTKNKDCEYSDEKKGTESITVDTQGCESSKENDNSSNPVENSQENKVDNENQPVIKDNENLPEVKDNENQYVVNDNENQCIEDNENQPVEDNENQSVEDNENQPNKNIENQPMDNDNQSGFTDKENRSDSDKIENEVTIIDGGQESILEDKDRQSSIEEKSHPSPWSFSQWSENYESLEDERPLEDISGDPQKLILWAAEKNELDTVRKLLEEDATLINARDNDLYTPLHRASYSNNVEVIKILLSFDADISSKTADGWEPLHCACKWDSVEAVSLLLQNGANVNARTKGNITPLHLAASNASGRRTLELLLWQPYIDPNIKTDAGDTAYDIAYRTGPLGALFEILEESVNIY